MREKHNLSIRREKGGISTDPKEIQRVIRDYYEPF
jgi:hypothetical protein